MNKQWYFSLPRHGLNINKLVSIDKLRLDGEFDPQFVLLFHVTYLRFIFLNYFSYYKRISSAWSLFKLITNRAPGEHQSLPLIANWDIKQAFEAPPQNGKCQGGFSKSCSNDRNPILTSTLS